MLKLYGNDEAEVLALRSGEADMIPIITAPTLIPQLIADKNIQVVIKTEYNQCMLLYVNHRYAPMNIKEFRQALNLAIDRQSLIDYAAHGYGTLPQQVPIAPSVPNANPAVKWNSTNATQTARIAQANAILDAKGWTKGADGIRTAAGIGRFSFELTSRADPEFINQASIIKDNLAAIGIEITLKTVASNTIGGILYKQSGEMTWKLALMGYPKPPEIDELVAEYGADPLSHWYDSGALGWFAVGSLGTSVGSTTWNSTDTQIQTLLKQSRRTTDQTQRQNILYQAQVLFAEEVPIIVLYHGVYLGAYRTDKYTNWNEQGSFYFGMDPPLFNTLNLVSLERIPATK
ncbi:MAG: ABC transporter substrate-binding protein [Chloroflexi bacterium]|nr:ABC transporter substrate-binding protein [Chloroflexota bacterium]